MARHAWLWVAGLVAVAGGCQHKAYEVDMAVEGDRITRSISVSIGTDADGILDALATAERMKQRASGSSARETKVPSPTAQPKKPADLGAVARIYKVDPAAPQPWKATFIGLTPNDVGGAGQMVRFKTNLGSAWIYLERFRGNPDPAAVLQARLEAADALSAVIAGWAKARLADRKGFAKFGTYLDGDFRKDFKNVSLFGWVLAAVRPMGAPKAAKNAKASPGRFLFSPLSLSATQTDIAAVALQYLVERKYFDAAGLSLIARWNTGAKGEVAALIKGLWRNFLTKKIGLADRALVEHLVSIMDRSGELKGSLDAYVRECAEYKEYLADARKRAPDNGTEGHDKPTPQQFLATLSTTALAPTGIDPLGIDDRLKLTLETGDAPVVTNGAWSKKTGKILWKKRFHSTESSLGRAVTDPLPAVCYAAWARPDEKFQKTRFGREILRGQLLLKYCLWRNGLTATEAKQWDAMIAKLRPRSRRTPLGIATTGPADWASMGLQILSEAMRK